MRNMLAALAATATLGLTASVASAAPAWCKGAQDGNTSEYDLKRLWDATDASDALPDLISAICFPNADTTPVAARLEELRKTWSQRLEMNEADWADAAVWQAMDQGSRNSPSMYIRDSKLAWSAWSPIDQYAGILNSTSGDSARVTDPAYVADALGAKLTHAGRLAFITRCLGSNSTPVHWAQCQPDIDAFDRKALAAELRTDTNYDGYKRMVVRIASYEIVPKLAEHAKAVKALVAKDPGYAQMFKLAAEASKLTDKTDPKLLAYLATMDDARVTNSRRAAEGCAAKSWELWKGVVSQIPAKSFAGFRNEPGDNFLDQAMAVIVGTPNGYVAAMSVYLCASFGDKPDYLARTIAEATSNWPGFRGPRNATHTAILAAGITLDDRDARIDYPDLDRPWIGRSGGSSGGGTGTLSVLKPGKNDTATIEFAKVKFNQRQCSKGRTTNRIVQIRSDGGLVYEYICTAYTTVTINEPPAPPQTVKAHYAEALKKGMFVSVTEDVVVVAYAKSGSEVPSVVAGVAVK